MREMTLAQHFASAQEMYEARRHAGVRIIAVHPDHFHGEWPETHGMREVVLRAQKEGRQVILGIQAVIYAYVFDECGDVYETDAHEQLPSQTPSPPSLQSTRQTPRSIASSDF